MNDKQKWEKLKSTKLFPESLQRRIPAVQAINWLHEHNAIFVVAPTPELCVNASINNGGVAPYFVRFLAFGDRAAKTLENVAKENPLLNYQDSLTSKNNLYSSFGYTVLTPFTYDQFIELIELVCESLVEKRLTIKRFEVSFDHENGGKLLYSALPIKQTFYSFLEGYEGEADLYDDSFVQYVGDIMSENLLLDERNDYTKPV